jgi:hypothetical protein
MDSKNDRLEQTNPGKAYNDELHQKGSTFTDSPIESAARDKAKIERTASPDSQKLDGNNPFAEEDTQSNEEVNREKYDDHK